LKASFEKLTHQLRRSVTAQHIVGGHTDLHLTLSHLNFNDWPALIIDTGFCLGLQLLPYLVGILFFRARARQKMLQLELISLAIFAV
jgi:hypothetical protein